jgi:hypothetical protein
LKIKYQDFLCLSFDLSSPLNPPILGDFKFFVPPELGARGRLIVDLLGRIKGARFIEDGSY